MVQAQSWMSRYFEVENSIEVDKKLSSNSSTMVFLLGKNFPDTSLVKKSLEKIYGIGHQSSSRILAKFAIFPRARIGSLPTKTVLALDAELSSMTIENDLRRQLQNNIKRLRDMGTYRGRRHAMGLPVRGQRTRSQIMTSRKLNRVERSG